MALVVGDIGGTNVRLQLWLGGDLTDSTLLQTGEFRGVADFLRHYFKLKSLSSDSVTCSLGVAGPCFNGGTRTDLATVCHFDGSSWPVEEARVVEKELGLPQGRVLFINDFECIGWALAARYKTSLDPKFVLPDSGLVSLHRPETSTVASHTFPIACIGAGTGLGACHLTPIPNTQEFCVFPSEAGMSATFSPRDDFEWDFLKFMRQKYPQHHLVLEKFVSGPTIADLFDFFLASGAQSDAKHSFLSSASSEQSAVICRHAEEGDALCLRAVDTFLMFLGRELAATAVRYLPYSGLFIAGGVVPKLQWRLKTKDNPLVDAYMDPRDRMIDTIKQVPLTLITDPQVGLRGALFCGLKQQEQ